jgi:hypothetical protein
MNIIANNAKLDKSDFREICATKFKALILLYFMSKDES